MITLESRIKKYLLEAKNKHQEQCYASYHEEAPFIIEDCLKIIERMRCIHAWCQCNIEMQTNVSKFAKEVRNAIEEIGVESGN